MTPACVWLLQFDTAVKEFSTALLEERYMPAAQRLEKVTVTPWQWRLMR